MRDRRGRPNDGWLDLVNTGGWINAAGGLRGGRGVLFRPVMLHCRQKNEVVKLVYPLQ